MFNFDFNSFIDPGKVDDTSPKLTMLSYGGGQDSHAILERLLNDPLFRQQYAPNDLIVVFADTLNEHNETYVTVAHAKTLCEAAGIPFFQLDPSKWVTGVWAGGLEAYFETGCIQTVTYQKVCTHRLKLGPIYKFLDHYIHETYGTEKPAGRKQALREFTGQHGKVRVLIGIATGEERRIDPGKGKEAWMRDCIAKVYPLVEQGMDRAACQQYIGSVSDHVPVPSNCMMCPFMSGQEILLLHRTRPDVWARWVEHEQRKLDKFNHLPEDKNHGVKGKLRLPAVLAKAELVYGHMTTEELAEYRFSHGHCVGSKH
jgi:hypothetical protein